MVVDLLEIYQILLLIVLVVLWSLWLINDLRITGDLVVGDVLLLSSCMVRTVPDVVLAFNLLSIASLSLNLLEGVVGLVLNWRLLDLLVWWRRCVVGRLVQGLVVGDDLRASFVRSIQVFILHLLYILEQKLLQLSSHVLLNAVNQLMLIEEIERLLGCLLALLAVFLLVRVRCVTLVVGSPALVSSTCLRAILVLLLLHVKHLLLLLGQLILLVLYLFRVFLVVVLHHSQDLALDVDDWLDVADVWDHACISIFLFFGSLLSRHRSGERARRVRLAAIAVVPVRADRENDWNEFYLFQVLLDLFGGGLGVAV